MTVSRHGDSWQNRVMSEQGAPVPAAADRGVNDRMPPLSVAAVARRLGVAPATLRTWDRRYGLGPSEHASGSHRRYGGVDLARLLVMRRLTIDGVAPADAARIALLSSPEADGNGVDTLVTPAQSRAARGDGTPSELVDVVLAGDDEGARRLLALRPGGEVLAWWSGLVEPATVALARRTVIDRPGVDASNMLEAAALAALRAAAPSDGVVGGHPVVLVLVPGGARRPLLVHVAAAALTARSVDARLVGGPLSPRHALELVAMTRAAAVVTASASPTPDLSIVGTLARERPDVPQYVMVPEVAAHLLPLDRTVHRSRSVPGVVHEVLAAVGATAGWPTTGSLPVVAPHPTGPSGGVS